MRYFIFCVCVLAIGCGGNPGPPPPGPIRPDVVNDDMLGALNGYRQAAHVPAVKRDERLKTLAGGIAGECRRNGFADIVTRP